MRRFASDTSVSVDSSIAEIRGLVLRYGGKAFGQAEGDSKFGVQFAMKERFVKFILPLPNREDKKYLRDGRGTARGPEWRLAKWEQDCRSRYRALALAIKAKLEAVETGITTFEEEFYAHILLPNGQTVYDLTKKNVAMAYASGQTPKMLMAGVE